MGKHAKLSASSAKKWLNCTGSVVMEQAMPDVESEYAEEGTQAHKLAELKIKKEIGLINHNEYYKQINNIAIDDEMEQYTEDYSDFVLCNYRKKLIYGNHALLLLEQKVDYSNYAKEGFGTADALIISGNTIEVIDLKYGKGVTVSAENNPQLMLYGLGALAEYDWLYDIKTVVMTIYQPRKDNISTFEMTAKELYDWGESIKQTAEIAYSGNGACNAGKHCTEGFCKGLPVCKTVANDMQEIEKYKSNDIEMLSNDEIAEILDKLDGLTKWAKAVKEYALQQALNGVEFVGFKLVEGRKSRCYSISNDEVAKLLFEKGYAENVVYKKELRSVADMEKQLKEDFNSVLWEFVIVKNGAPTIARMEDKRHAFNSAEYDFRDIETF